MGAWGKERFQHGKIARSGRREARRLMASAMAAGREASFENLLASVLPAAIAEGEPGDAPSVRSAMN